MKSRQLLLSTLATAALLSSGAVLAQDTPAQTPPPTSAPASRNNTAYQTSQGQQESPAAQKAVYDTPQGQLTVRSLPPPAVTAGPAPSFEQLSSGSKGITPDQATAYPLLANDFRYADSNHNGRVSKTEYQRWLKHS